MAIRETMLQFFMAKRHVERMCSSVSRWYYDLGPRCHRQSTTLYSCFLYCICDVVGGFNWRSRKRSRHAKLRVCSRLPEPQELPSVTRAHASHTSPGSCGRVDDADRVPAGSSSAARPDRAHAPGNGSRPRPFAPPVCSIRIVHMLAAYTFIYTYIHIRRVYKHDTCTFLRGILDRRLQYTPGCPGTHLSRCPTRSFFLLLTRHSPIRVNVIVRWESLCTRGVTRSTSCLPWRVATSTPKHTNKPTLLK